MRKIFSKHKDFWTKRHFLIEVLFGVLMLLTSILTTYYANYYTFSLHANSVNDILLDNLPVIDVSFLFNQGAFIFLAVVALILLYEPIRIPFSLKTISIFVFVRSVFITFTHLAPPIKMPAIDTSDLLYKISSGNDLFFSAHTGMPFLLALIFWHKKPLRYFFLACSVAGAIVVILGHLHYSIDVFSAFFISYGIFHFCRWLFDKDYELLLSEN